MRKGKNSKVNGKPDIVNLMTTRAHADAFHQYYLDIFYELMREPKYAEMAKRHALEHHKMMVELLEGVPSKRRK